MEEITEKELIVNGLKLLDDALTYFEKIKGYEGYALSKIIHSAIILTENIYKLEK